MGNLKARQFSCGLLQRQLHVEHLEDRRLLAMLIGADFDVVGTTPPEGFVSVQTPAAGTFTLPAWDGVELFVKVGFGSENSANEIIQSQIPFDGSGIDLSRLDGSVLAGDILFSSGGVSATWSNLSGAAYEVYAFAVPGIDNQKVTFSGVEVGSGRKDVTFQHKGGVSDELLLNVNDRQGSSTRPLTSFAKYFKPLSESISVVVAGAYTTVAGLAIREALLVTDTGTTVDPNDGVTTLSEAVDIANATPGHDTIIIDPSLSGRTIALGGTQKVITEGLTIDGSLLAVPVTIDAHELSRIFDVTTPAGQLVVLDTLNLTGGRTTGENADENDNTNSGGAIRYFQNNPSPSSPSGSTGDVGAGLGAATGGLHIRNSLITGNITAGKFAYGGAVFADGPSFITDSIIRGNHTEGMYGNGGAIRANGGLTVTGSIIEDNFTMGPSAEGGGINAVGGATITDSAIRNNRTLGDFSGGGGITNSGFGSPRGTMTFTRSTISGNWTMGQFSSGAGIAANLDITITDSNIFDNNTYGNNANGAAISSFGGDLTITGSSIYNNATAGDAASGGAISVNGPLIVNSSTISGNSVGGANADGGAILSGVDVTLSQSTLFGNHATGTGARGGGIINFGGDVVLNSSIVAGNTATGEGPDLHPIVVFGATLTANYSLVGDVNGETIGGTGSIIGDSQGTGPVNPLLGPLADNGGAALTHLPLPASPAIDMGDPAFAAPPTYDQRGFAFDRVVGGRIDIGAVEGGATSADFDTNGTINGADFLIWQRGYGMMPVNHADGDANLDGAVSDTDLSLWSGSFGQSAVTPLMAPVVGSGYRRAGMMGGSAVLIDAAMALEWIDSSAHEEAIFVTEPATLESADAVNVKSAGLTLAASVSSDFDFVSSSSDQIEDHDEPWLAEALLERVFG